VKHSCHNLGNMAVSDNGTLSALLRVRRHPQDVVVLPTSLNPKFDPLGKGKGHLTIFSTLLKFSLFSRPQEKDPGKPLASQ